MYLYYFKSRHGNFGDDLNPFLIERLIPYYQNIQQNIVLIFIGTILDDRFKSFTGIPDFRNKKKLVFGSGVRNINKPPVFDDLWEIRFLRGPLSSYAIFGNNEKFITDPAYLVRILPRYSDISNIPKKYKISIMPHYHSLSKVDWEKIGLMYNIHFIDVTNSNIDQTIMEIAESDYLLTEAMHGAIIADALRVPWARFRYSSHFHEQDVVSEFKWADWLYSMNLRNLSKDLYYNRYLKIIDSRFKFKQLKKIREKHIISSLEDLLKSPDYQLSSENIFHQKVNQLQDQLIIFK